jgi:serine/threonine protein kinase
LDTNPFKIRLFDHPLICVQKSYNSWVYEVNLRAKDSQKDEPFILKMWPQYMLKEREIELNRELSRLVVLSSSVVAIKHPDVQAWLCQPGGKTVDFCRGILLEKCDADLFDYIEGCKEAASSFTTELDLMFEQSRSLITEFYSFFEVMGCEDRRQLAQQVLEAYNECHASNIGHRDVKPQNILVKNEAGRRKIKLCDFATSYEHKSGGTKRGTVAYTVEKGFCWASPEMLLKAICQSSTPDVNPLAHDLWGIGW